MTFSAPLIRHGVGRGTSLRRMPKGALMSGVENRPRGRRLCPRRRAVDCAAVGNVKMWNCGNVKVWKYENGLGLRQIPPRGARGRGAESAALGQLAGRPLGGTAYWDNGHLARWRKGVFPFNFNGRDARCPSVNGRDARCPSCARSTLLHGYSTHFSTLNGRDARCPSRVPTPHAERGADVGF